MRRVIFLVSVLLVLGVTGCAKHHARRYASAYYGAPCGCDSAVGPIDGGVIVPGPIGVSPQAVGALPGPIGKTVSSTPIQGPPAAY